LRNTVNHIMIIVSCKATQFGVATLAAKPMYSLYFTYGFSGFDSALSISGPRKQY